MATLNPVAGCMSGAAAPNPTTSGARWRAVSTGKWTRSTSASGDGVMAYRARRASSRSRRAGIGRPGRRASDVSSSSTRPPPTGTA